MKNLQLVSAQSNALKKNGKIEVRDGDYIVTYKYKRFRLCWQDNNKIIQTIMLDEKSAEIIHRKILKRESSIRIERMGRMITLSFMHNPTIEEIDPDRRFDPEELPPEKEAENIKRINLAKMEAIQKANPESWKKAKDSKNHFKSMGNILKSSHIENS